MIKPFAIDGLRSSLAALTAGALVLVLAQGCATRRTFPNTSSGAVILNHDFPAGFTSKGRERAVVQSAFDFWGADVSRSDIPRMRADHFLFLSDLTAFGDAHDLRVCGFSGSIGQLEDVIAGGCPVLVVLEPDQHQSQVVLVFGFDDEKRVFYLHDGRRRFESMRYSDFMIRWQPRRHFMITVVPPDRADWAPVLPEAIATAEYWARKGDWDRAALAYAQARDIAPENMDLLYGRASVWERAHDWRKAELVYREILTRDSLQARAANNLSHVLLLQGAQTGEPARWAMRAVTIDPGNPVYLATWGEVCERDGNLGEAVSSLEKAHHRASVLSQDQQRDILSSLVRVYLATDQDHLARQVIAAHRKRDPLYDPAISP